MTTCVDERVMRVYGRGVCGCVDGLCGEASVRSVSEGGGRYGAGMSGPTRTNDKTLFKDIGTQEGTKR